MASPETAKSDEFRMQDEIVKSDEPKGGDVKKQAGIGRGLSDNLLIRAREELEHVPVQENYKQRAEVRFPFEPLDGRDITKEVAVSWLKNKDNVQRVADRLGKEIMEEGSDLLYGWAAVRIKRLSEPGRLNGLSKSTQAAVLIALSDWNKENGFFLSNVEMASGEDIILDGGEEIIFPGSGGALVIIFYLQLSPSPC